MKIKFFKFKSYTDFILKSIMVLFFFFEYTDSFAQDKEFKSLYKDGKVYREGKLIKGYCGVVLQETIYDGNGNKIRRTEWKNKKRCGMTTIYKSNLPFKEIKFKDDLMVSYVAYKNGLIYIIF